MLLAVTTAITSSNGPVQWLSSMPKLDHPPWENLHMPGLPTPGSSTTADRRDPLSQHASHLMSSSDTSELKRLLSGNWKVLTTYRGITVYERRTPGSSQVCLRAEGELSASAEVCHNGLDPQPTAISPISSLN